MKRKLLPSYLQTLGLGVVGISEKRQPQLKPNIVLKVEGNN
jgi:hypothetical protein